jgi:hypothetical protein
MNAAECLREQYTNRGPHNKGWSQGLLKEAVKERYHEDELNIVAFKTAIKSLLECGKLEKIGAGNTNYHFPKGYKHPRSTMNTPMPSPSKSKSKAKKVSPSMKKKTATKGTARKSTTGKAKAVVKGKKKAVPKKIAAEGKGTVPKRAAPKERATPLDIDIDIDTGEGGDDGNENEDLPEMEGVVMPTDMDLIV